MQNYVQAIQVYSEILEIDPDDDVALMNRAFAFIMRDDFQSGIQDLTKVLDNNPGNLMALKSKATLLAQFECVSYDNCKPNEALELLDVALDDNPDDEDLKMKRDFLLSKAETFEVSETNGDYMINIQLITRDQNGTLSSVCLLYTSPSPRDRG